MSDLATEVSGFVAAHWRNDMSLRSWWALLADAGLAKPTWPIGYGGRGLSKQDANVVGEALALAGVISPAMGGVGSGLAAPTILDVGTDSQIAKYVRAIADGTESWVQLWSEPGAGSDLPSLSASAVVDGDEWVISGQKVWNSSADVADRAMLLARTTPGSTGHAGITYFILDMHQTGVDVRPLIDMVRESHFNEVFLTDVRVSTADVLGNVGDGWSVVHTTLGHERKSVTSRGARNAINVQSGGVAGNLDRTVGELVAMVRNKPAANDRKFALPWRTMLDLARIHGCNSDPVIRQQLVGYYTMNNLFRWSGQRWHPSITKLWNTQVCQASRELSLNIVGANGMLLNEVSNAALRSPGARIGGGTDEIQRNTLGERALGLPREPSLR